MLPQFGFSEFVFLALVALIFVGPKDLPIMMRRLGQLFGKARAMANEFRAAFDDIARQAELDELKAEIEELKNSNAVKEAADEMRGFEREVNERVIRESPPAEARSDPAAQAGSKPGSEGEA